MPESAKEESMETAAELAGLRDEIRSQIELFEAALVSLEGAEKIPKDVIEVIRRFGSKFIEIIGDPNTVLQAEAILRRLTEERKELLAISEPDHV